MPSPVGADRDDARAVRRVGAGVEQRLQVAAGAGDEDDEAGAARARSPDHPIACERADHALIGPSAHRSC